MQWLASPNQRENGFTLIELLIVIVITAILFGLIAVNLGQPQKVANITTSVDSLLSDIRSQQVLAMAGGKGSQTSAQAQGIYLQSGQYTLFAGSTYNAGDSNNFAVQLPAGVQLTTNFSGGILLFHKGDGCVGNTTNCTGTSGTITLTNGIVSHTITINRLGAPQVS